MALVGIIGLGAMGAPIARVLWTNDRSHRPKRRRPDCQGLQPICTIVNTLGAAEAMLMAERAGVYPSKVKQVLMAGFGASRMLDLQAPRMIARDFDGKQDTAAVFTVIANPGV